MATATKIKPKKMSEERFEEVARQDRRLNTGIHSLTVHEGGWRIYCYRSVKRTTMFMGDFKYKFEYNFHLYKDGEFRGNAPTKKQLLCSWKYPVLEKWS